MSNGGLVRGMNVFCDKCDLHAQGLLGLTGSNMAFRKIHVAQRMRGERKGCFSSLEFAIVARLMKELPFEPKGLTEEP